MKTKMIKGKAGKARVSVKATGSVSFSSAKLSTTGQRVSKEREVYSRYFGSCAH